MTKFIIVRGIPGSGKSTIAKMLVESLKANHFEADMYFIKNNEYVFDFTKLGAAHKWCIDETEKSLLSGKDTIVSNTFTTVKELKPYFELSKKLGLGYPIVMTAAGCFKNIHNVPEESLTKMRERFQHDLSSLYQ